MPRGHNCVNNAMDALSAVTAYAQEHGAEFHFGTTVESLVVDDGGAAAGVLAKRGNGSTVLYNAKNVIVSTGGFCRNVEMIDGYCPDYSGVYTEVGVGCTGEGLQMGLDIGADYVGHGGTNGILACPVEPGQSKLISNKALWINSKGERFANEAGQTHDIYYDVAHFDDQKFFAVYDQAMVDALDEDLRSKLDFGLEQGMFAKADTVAEAAAALGIDGAAAQTALDAYNELAASGEDTQFKKKAENLVPLAEAPFYVLTMGVCTHGSFGGYRVNTEFQVLDTDGQPIPHLYAAGEFGGIASNMYQGGGNMAECMIFGKVAGANAAAKKDPLPTYAVAAVESSPTYLPGKETDMAEEKSYDTSENEYVGKGQGIGGDVVVKVTMDGDKMSAIEVLEQSETPDIGGKALESLPQTVLDAQSVDVDAVSGATTTSKAFFAAVTEALGQAS